MPQLTFYMLPDNSAGTSAQGTLQEGGTARQAKTAILLGDVEQ
jgi:hypothetical protein